MAQLKSEKRQHLHNKTKDTLTLSTIEAIFISIDDNSPEQERLYSLSDLNNSNSTYKHSSNYSNQNYSNQNYHNKMGNYQKNNSNFNKKQRPNNYNNHSNINFQSHNNNNFNNALQRPNNNNSTQRLNNNYQRQITIMKEKYQLSKTKSQQKSKTIQF